MSASMSRWLLLVALLACKKAPPAAPVSPAATAEVSRVEAILTALESDLAEYEAAWEAAEKLPGPDGVAQELAHRVEVDQRVRQVATPADLTEKQSNALWRRLGPLWSQVDEGNTAWLAELVETHGWITRSAFGEQASRDAWLLAQHADHDRDFQRLVLELMEPLVPDEVDAQHFAYLYDRIAVADKRPQRFGTQGKCSKDGWTPFRIEEPETVDDRRAEIGLETMARYEARFDCTGEGDLADAAYAEEKWAECAERYASLAGGKDGPAAATLWYNAACCAARGEDPDHAFEWLEDALEAGWTNLEHLQADSDLQSLHTDPRWEGLVRP